MRKTRLETYLKSCLTQPKTTPLYRPPNSSPWGPTQQEILLSVDRPVDRPTVKFMTVAACRSTAWSIDLRLWPIGRSPGRSRPDPESKALSTIDQSVDRPSSQNWQCTFLHIGRPPGRATLVRSTGRSTARRPGQPFIGIKTWFYIFL